MVCFNQVVFSLVKISSIEKAVDHTRFITKVLFTPFQSFLSTFYCERQFLLLLTTGFPNVVLRNAFSISGFFNAFRSIQSFSLAAALLHSSFIVCSLTCSLSRSSFFQQGQVRSRDVKFLLGQKEREERVGLFA